MELSDVERVVALQLELLQSSAVTQLGPRFLRRFYRVALASGSCEAVVACGARQEVIGAVIATGDLERFNAYVTPRILPWLAASLFTRWGLAWRFLGSLFERKPKRDVRAELLLLFLDRPYQRLGGGTELVRAIDEAFLRNGIVEYRVSVRSEITNALAFYAAKGFQHDEELIVLGRPMTYFARRLRA